VKTITLHSYPFYVADWVRSETRAKLSSAGRNIFRELLDYCWIEGDLPTDEDALMAIAGATRAEFSKCWPQISTKFTLQDGRYHHWKVDVERPRLISWRESRKNAGKLGGKASAQSRAEAKNSSSTASSTASSDAEATSKPSSSSSSSSTTASLRAAVVVARTTAAAPFEPFDGPDPEALVSEAVETVAKFWPRLGNVPLAKMCWKLEAARHVGGVAEWCERIVATAFQHAKAHQEAQAVNRRHFIPDLSRWVQDGDYARKAPEAAPAEQRRRFDPSKLEEIA